MSLPIQLIIPDLRLLNIPLPAGWGGDELPAISAPAVTGTRRELFADPFRHRRCTCVRFYTFQLLLYDPASLLFNFVGARL